MSGSPDDLIRADVRAMAPYHVPESAGMIKLDAMENPYRLPMEVALAIAERMGAVPLNRYPDPQARDLKSALRAAMAIPEDMQIVLGNGSDELIQMLALAVAAPTAAMLGLEPSFAMFRIVASHTGMRYVGVDLNADFAIDAPRTLAHIARARAGLLFIAYPNNPTGNLFSAESIAQIIDAFPGLVVIDEAYHPFAQRTFMSRLNEFPNLLVMRTVSKLGLAGLRLGMLVGSERWLKHIDKVRLPYNVNVLTQIAAAEVLKHSSLLEFQAAAIREERGRVADELSGIAGTIVYPSAANFILFRIGEADRVFNALKERRILIKNLNGYHSLLANCLRVTIGTPEENNQFLAALRESV